MVIKKLPILVPISLLLLVSCNQKVLREDVKNFIANFSLENSMNEYKEAGYESLAEVSDGKDITKTKEKLDFNIKDESNITYSYFHKEYKNEELTSETTVSISTVESKYIYSDKDGEKEISLDEVKKVVSKFFYTTDEYDFHNYGCYYGDIINESAYDFQNVTTIDDEAGLLTIEYSTKLSNENATAKQKIVANKLGMLVSNDFEIKGNGKYSKESIMVYKK